jgi:hypothetical protein
MWVPKRGRAEPEERGRQHREEMMTRIEVTSTVQVNTGIRNIVMPGARMQRIVVMKLTAPRMVPKPPMRQPEDPQVAAEPGAVVGEFDSGA